MAIYRKLVEEALRHGELRREVLPCERDLAFAATPPIRLVVASALNSIGGGHLDMGEYEEACQCTFVLPLNPPHCPPVTPIRWKVAMFLWLSPRLSLRL